jgi:hypothetical protein
MTNLLRVGALGAALVFVNAVLVPGCGNETSITVKCNPGAVQSCTCPGGGFGEQSCGGDEQFGPCSCTSGSGGSGGRNNADAANDAPTLATGKLLSSGTSRLIDVFVGDSGIFVVAIDSVSVVDRAGVVIHALPAPREITAAAFDGTTLAVADKAFLKMYSTDLTEVASPALTESCVSVAIASGNRVLCAGAATFPTKFYTFDATNGTLILMSSVSSGSTAVPMRRVPGKDDLVTLDSSNFRLLRIDGTSQVTALGESPFSHMYRASPVFGFTGTTSDHLVTEDAILANIYAAQCVPSSTTTPQCFVQDGALGTLRGMERFIGLDGDDASGKAHALVDTTSSFGLAGCRSGCAVQSIDVAGRIVETSKLYALDLGQTVAVRHDAKADALIAGFSRPTGGSSTSPGYRVELLGYH